MLYYPALCYSRVSALPCTLQRVEVLSGVVLLYLGSLCLRLGAHCSLSPWGAAQSPTLLFLLVAAWRCPSAMAATSRGLLFTHILFDTPHLIAGHKTSDTPRAQATMTDPNVLSFHSSFRTGFPTLLTQQRIPCIPPKGKRLQDSRGRGPGGGWRDLQRVRGTQVGPAIFSVLAAGHPREPQRPFIPGSLPNAEHRFRPNGKIGMRRGLPAVFAWGLDLPL